jgi:FixJ family two-component response regulator
VAYDRERWLQWQPCVTDAVCVFVVDDDWAIRDILCELLDGEGCEAHGFSGSADALAKMPQRRPAVVFVDVIMPDVDCEAFVHAARSIAHEATIVLMSGDRHRLAAIQLADVVHLHKPFSVEQVLAVLGDGMGRSSRARTSSAPPP